MFLRCKLSHAKMPITTTIAITKISIFAIILVLLRGDNIMGYTLDMDGIKDISSNE